TKTVTITECNPTATNCPHKTSTVVETSTATPEEESTTSYGSSFGSFVSSSARPSATGSYIPPVIETTTSVVEVAPTPTTTPSTIPTGAAGSLFVQPALLLGVVGAGVALLA